MLQVLATIPVSCMCPVSTKSAPGTVPVVSMYLVCTRRVDVPGMFPESAGYVPGMYKVSTRQANSKFQAHYK